MPKTADTALSAASAADLRRELGRRIGAALRVVAGEVRWSATDWVFAGVVATLALSSAGFFTATYRIFSADPDYFSRRLIAGMEPRDLDPIETGGIAAAGGGGTGEGEAAATGPLPDGAMPAQTVRRAHEPAPVDYQLVMVFGDEAMLSTARELMRVKVGSVVPGLGTVVEIDAATGAVRSEKATLRMVAP